MKAFMIGFNMALKPILAIILIVNYYYLFFYLKINFFTILSIGAIGGFFLGASLREIKNELF